MKTWWLLSLCVCSGLHAQTLLPELAPLAAKHQAEIATLKTQDETTAAKLRKTYEDALAGAEKVASVGGNKAALTAIGEDRTALDTEQGLPPKFPAALPATLKSPRQTYLDGRTRFIAEKIAREQRAYTTYLRSLADLQQKAPAGSELARQIAAEKDQAQDKTPVSPPAGTNRLVNGNFAEVDHNGFPKGWVAETLNSTSDYGSIFKTVTEKNETFLHAEFAGRQERIKQIIPLPPGMTKWAVKAYVRGIPDSKGEKLTVIRIGVRLGRSVSPDPLNDRPTSWRLYQAQGEIPKDADVIGVQIDTIGKGTFDIQRVELEFR